MPRPTGLVPSLRCTTSVSPMALATPVSRACKTSAACDERTLAVGPTGMSISTSVAPTAAFFDRTLATNWPMLSKSSGRSMRINRSSAGLRLSLPPQTMHPPSASATRRKARVSRSTGAMTSMVSAVPAGEVIARDEVFGINCPAAATMATTIGVVRLPGNPPTQCLSSTRALPQSSVSPAACIACVSAVVSGRSSRSPAQAVTNAARSRSESRWSRVSAMMLSNAARSSA